MRYVKNVLRYLSGVPAVFVLLTIFVFSAQDGNTSGSLSFKLCYALTEFADRIFSSGLSKAEIISRASSIQLVVRKLAHITEYFLLTLGFFLPLQVWLPYKGIKTDGKQFFSRLIFPSFLLSLLSAAADEFHQSFVPGRCGTPVDVLVDSVGILGGCLFLTICHRLIRNKRRRCNKC